MSLREFAQETASKRKQRVQALRKYAVEVVANRKMEILVPPPNVHVSVPEAIPPSVLVEAPVIEQGNVLVENKIAVPSVTVPVQVNVPEAKPPTVNVHVPEHRAVEIPPINVQVIVPPEAIKVEVVVSPQEQLKEPPTKAVVEHEDGTKSTITLE